MKSFIPYRILPTKDSKCNKLSALNLFKLPPYCKFGFSRPDLDGNKLAKGMCLVRKARDREAFSHCTEGRQLFLRI